MSGSPVSGAPRWTENPGPAGRSPGLLKNYLTDLKFLVYYLLMKACNRTDYKNLRREDYPGQYLFA